MVRPRIVGLKALLTLLLTAGGCNAYSKMIYPSAAYHPAPHDVIEKVEHVDFTASGVRVFGFPLGTPDVCKRLGQSAPRNSGLRLADVQVTTKELYIVGNVVSVPMVHVEADVIRVQSAGGAR